MNVVTRRIRRSRRTSRTSSPNPITTAGVPHFRKLYGRIEQPNLKKGDVLKFVIHNNFEVASFKGRKALVLATDNFIGGRNFGIGILFLVGSVLSFAFVIGILVVMRVCPE